MGRGEGRQHISVNQKKLESSDHQLVEEFLINGVMGLQVCREMDRDNHAGCLPTPFASAMFRLLRWTQSTRSVSGLRLEPTWCGLRLPCLRANGKE